MENNIESVKSNKRKINLKYKVTICVALLILFLSVNLQIGCSTVKATDTLKNSESNGKCYLSDISYVDGQSSAASGHTIKLDKNDSDKMITLKVSGEPQVFIKGISAWASSHIVYDISHLNYDYFTSYIGVDISEQDTYFNTGVKFYIYTSNDMQNWEKKFESGVFYGWSDAQHIEVDVRNVKYLKLVADNNSPNWWAEWYDEAIFADAKLIKEGYVEDETSTVDFVKTLDEYDEIIRLHEGEEITGEYELALLQRELVSNAGYDILQYFARSEESYKETLQWLMSDLETLRLYVLGGEPDGNYISSLQALTKLYNAHKEDLSNTNKTAHGTVYGDLYRKMMITLSLTHSAQVSLWMDTTSPENQSDPVTRYEIFKKLHEEGKFVVSSRQDHTPWFEDLKVEEMRYVLNNIIDDEEILWLNEYTQKYIDANPNKEEEYLQPHHYMKYIDPDYAKPEYHDLANKEMWDEKYDFLRYGVTYRPGVVKLWMNIENGAVCGGISKIGSNIRGVHGTPSSVISQPGHAALIYYRKDENGNGYWTIDNDVSGWAQSGKTEKLSVRMPLGWGSDSYVEGWAASYIVLAQEALNHYDAYEQATELIMEANSYKGNPAKQEELYRKALAIQPINIDAWYALINLYKEDTTKTEEDYYKLAQEIGENLKCFPLPMYNLTNLIKPMLTSTGYSFKFTVLQINLLTEGSTWTDNTQVYQPNITRTVASFLLGQMDKDLATFSFDGENAGKIILSERYDGNGIHWEYSLNGKVSWTPVTFTADEKHEKLLSTEEINSITAENDIYIHIVGTGYEESNLYKIDITSQKNPDTLYANDLENRVVGVTLNTQWRYGEGDEWTTYSISSPQLTGDKTVQIREPATGTMLASEPITYNFTEDAQEDTRKYVPVSHLSIHAVSSEATSNQGAATHCIDGNYNTRWHSDWGGKDQERYIVIKVDKVIYLSAVEFVPAGGGNGKILDGTIYGSMDGENWEELSNVKNLANNEEIKHFEIENPTKVQYIKIVADRASNGNWFTARMFNIYQDLTKNPHPTAGIAYSTTEPTNQNVEVRLINPSTNIKITNNNGSDTYIFEDNGTFTFEFIDEETNKKGTAEAKVDWIDRVAPTATFEYSIETITYDEVVAKLIPSEEVTILNNVDDTYTFEENGEFTFEFKDAAGNLGSATAKVYWIGATQDLLDPENPDIEVEPETSEAGKIVSDEYKVENEYISDVTSDTTVSAFKEKVKSNKRTTFIDKNGNILEEDGVVTTDTVVKLEDDTQYTLVVKGDVDCNGKVTINDLAKMKLHLVNMEKLEGTKLKAASMSGNSNLSINDIAKMKLMLLK